MPFYAPIYSYECIATMKAVIATSSPPAVLGRTTLMAQPDHLEAVDFIKGHNHAKAAVETAMWHLESRQGVRCGEAHRRREPQGKNWA